MTTIKRNLAVICADITSDLKIGINTTAHMRALAIELNSLGLKKEEVKPAVEKAFTAAGLDAKKQFSRVSEFVTIACGKLPEKHADMNAQALAKEMRPTVPGYVARGSQAGSNAAKATETKKPSEGIAVSAMSTVQLLATIESCTNQLKAETKSKAMLTLLGEIVDMVGEVAALATASNAKAA